LRGFKLGIIDPQTRALIRKTRTTERVITAVGRVTCPVTVPYSLGGGPPTDGFHPYTGYGRRLRTTCSQLGNRVKLLYIAIRSMPNQSF
jgi:hypothetical protein